MKKIKYLTLMLFISTPLFAATSSAGPTSRDLNFSLGNLCEYVGKIQTDGEGKSNTCSFLPTLAGSYDIFLTKELALSPQLGATLPKTGRDENIKRMTLFALLNGKYKTSYLTFIAGAGLYFTRIWGPGGDEELNNGNSTDSFPLPKDPVYSRNFIVNLGAGYDFNTTWSAELYTYVFNALESEDRAFSVGATLSYHFGDVL
nr:transporter [Bacteriovorax sp. HI3]